MSSAARPDLLVEIGTEELPYAAQAPLALALEAAVAGMLRECGIAPADTRPLWTPRRLAVLALEVAEREPEREIERRGPSLAAAFDAEGRPTRAATGFARSAGVAVEELQTLRTPEGEWLVHRHTRAGRLTPDVLLALLPDVLNRLPLPRRMRWGAGESVFLRPVRWLTVRYGEACVPVSAFGLVAGAETYGHRIHHPGPVRFARPTDYVEALIKAKVIVDPGERYVAVKDAVEREANALGLVPAVPSDALYTEISGMTEWPVAVAARFELGFLELPDPVLVTTLVHHQRFVPLRRAGGGLSENFVAVLNLESREPDAVRHGLERVVRPRLEDAAFYFERDRGRKLADYADELAGLAFGPGLGSMKDKSARLSALATRVAAAVPDADTQAAARAGLLAKCDLVTGMVFEFPELQGVMGGIYARESEPAEVAEAIGEHYRPAGADDGLPASAAGIALALADRLDTLVGGFAADLRPTGTKDPFGLRRAAFGALRIAIEKLPGLDLDPLLEAAAAAYPPGLAAREALPAVREFLRERLRSLILERELGPDVAQAVLAVAPLVPGDVLARAEALVQFRLRPESQALAAANKRIANILRQAVAGETVDTGIRPAAADYEPAEASLAAALTTAEPVLKSALAAGDYATALAALAGLRTAVDRFFDEVLVMEPDPALRARRLSLLARLRAAFLDVADIGELQPATGP